MILVISPLKHYMFNLMLTGFVPFFRNKFPGLFQDFSRIQIDLSRALKFTLTRYTPKISMLILLTAFNALHNFLVEFNRFPELSRTSGFFPGLASPGKFHNKIPVLSRFSRTSTNPYQVDTDTCLGLAWSKITSHYQNNV